MRTNLMHLFGFALPGLTAPGPSRGGERAFADVLAALAMTTAGGAAEEDVVPSAGMSPDAEMGAVSEGEVVPCFESEGTEKGGPMTGGESPYSESERPSDPSAVIEEKADLPGVGDALVDPTSGLRHSVGGAFAAAPEIFHDIPAGQVFAARALRAEAADWLDANPEVEVVQRRPGEDTARGLMADDGGSSPIRRAPAAELLGYGSFRPVTALPVTAENPASESLRRGNAANQAAQEAANETAQEIAGEPGVQPIRKSPVPTAVTPPPVTDTPRQAPSTIVKTDRERLSEVTGPPRHDRSSRGRANPPAPQAAPANPGGADNEAVVLAPEITPGIGMAMPWTPPFGERPAIMREAQKSVSAARAQFSGLLAVVALPTADAGGTKAVQHAPIFSHGMAESSQTGLRGSGPESPVHRQTAIEAEVAGLPLRYGQSMRIIPVLNEPAGSRRGAASGVSGPAAMVEKPAEPRPSAAGGVSVREALVSEAAGLRRGAAGAASLPTTAVAEPAASRRSAAGDVAMSAPAPHDPYKPMREQPTTMHSGHNVEDRSATIRPVATVQAPISAGPDHVVSGFDPRQGLTGLDPALPGLGKGVNPALSSHGLDAGAPAGVVAVSIERLARSMPGLAASRLPNEPQRRTGGDEAEGLGFASEKQPRSRHVRIQSAEPENPPTVSDLDARLRAPEMHSAKRPTAVVPHLAAGPAPKPVSAVIEGAPAGGTTSGHAGVTAADIAVPSSQPEKEAYVSSYPSGARSVTAGAFASVARPGGVPLHPVIRQLAEGLPDNGKGSVEITLSPEELGRVRMTLTPGEGGLAVHIQADRPETLDLLRRNIDQLARELSQMGQDSAAFTFGGGRRDDTRRPHGSEPATGGAVEGVRQPDSPPTRRIAPEDGLDILL